MHGELVSFLGIYIHGMHLQELGSSFLEMNAQHSQVTKAMYSYLSPTPFEVVKPSHIHVLWLEIAQHLHTKLWIIASK